MEKYYKSFFDADGRLFVSCWECTKGFTSKNHERCHYGNGTRAQEHLGCFIGELMPDIDKARLRSLPRIIRHQQGDRTKCFDNSPCRGEDSCAGWDICQVDDLPEEVEVMPCCYGELDQCDDRGVGCPHQVDCASETVRLMQKNYQDTIAMRKEFAREEMTMNPIFILLRVTYLCPETCSDRPDDFEEDCPRECECEDMIRTEHPVHVFASREEGEKYGHSQEHNLGKNLLDPENSRKKEGGWLVFCVPAMGSLADILGRTE